MCETSLLCDKNPSVAIGIMINIFTFLHFGPLDHKHLFYCIFLSFKIGKLYSLFFFFSLLKFKFILTWRYPWISERKFKCNHEYMWNQNILYDRIYAYMCFFFLLPREWETIWNSIQFSSSRTMMMWWNLFDYFNIYKLVCFIFMYDPEGWSNDELASAYP